MIFPFNIVIFHGYVTMSVFYDLFRSPKKWLGWHPHDVPIDPPSGAPRNHRARPNSLGRVAYRGWWSATSATIAAGRHGGKQCIVQWEFQDPKMEVPTIYKAYIRPMYSTSILGQTDHLRPRNWITCARGSLASLTQSVCAALPAFSTFNGSLAPSEINVVKTR